MKSSIQIESINAMAELERLGWKYQPLSQNELGVLCPVHDDTSPSVNLATTKNTWFCNACKAKGDIISLIAHIITKSTGKKIERQTVITDLSTRYDLESIKAIGQDVIERHHLKVWDSGPLLEALRARGVTDDMIRKARLGYHEGRIIIPVFDHNWNVVNLRRYLPGAPGPEKMKNVAGYGVPARIYQIDQLLKFEKVWLCGGEIKALVAGGLLNPHGVGAVNLTASEGSWEVKWNHHFKGKLIFVCYDVDSTGVAGARHVASQLVYAGAKVYIVRLPLDPDKYPKGDLNDYVGQEGASAVELLQLMETAQEYVPEKLSDLSEQDKNVVQTKLVDSARPENVGHRLRMDGIVNAMEETPYLVPKVIDVACDKNQPNCMWCPVKPKEQDPTTGKVTLTIRGTERGIMEMVGQPEKNQREAIREAARIPTCKAATFTVKSHYNVWDVRLVPQLQIGGDNADHVVVPALIVGQEIDLNMPYVLEGRIHPHPKNQQATLLIDGVTQAEDSLNSFAPHEDELKTLSVFQPSDWSVGGIQEVLDRYYRDIEANVTRIFHRRQLHLTIDLTYLSSLYFYFDGRLQHGWVNTLVAGDSAQGKTEGTQRIMAHYGLGERVECKNASVAGLLGGLENMGQRFFVRWGAIPMHDRRLVVLEEVNGTPVEVIGKLTDMRSSGVAELQKIEKRKAHARTRLMFVANPRSNRPLSQYNFGIEAISELIGSPQDIRRFDLAVLMSSSQIDPKVINKLSNDRPKIPHTFNADLCRRAVLWAWTRAPTQVVFDPDAEVQCLEAASALCAKFSDEMPLVDKGTMRYKLARLSVALAARTFSTRDNDLNTIRVRKCHVEYITQFINTMYSDPVFGYEDFSKAQEYAQNVITPEIVDKHIRASKYPKDFVENLLHTTEITLVDIQDWCELDRDTAQKLLSFLVRKHALYRDQRVYVKTSTFIILLKKMKANGLPNTSEGNTKEKF